MVSSSFCRVAQTLCLSSIYEDLKMYQVEFKAINANLVMDPKRQIILDQNMLAAIDNLMQVRHLPVRAPSSCRDSQPGSLMRRCTQSVLPGLGEA